MVWRLLAKFYRIVFWGWRLLHKCLLANWRVILLAMLCFALNRYAVFVIAHEKRELQTRDLQLRLQIANLKEQNRQIESKLQESSDPRLQEMLIMQHLLLFPASTQVYRFEPAQEMKTDTGED